MTTKQEDGEEKARNDRPLQRGNQEEKFMRNSTCIRAKSRREAKSHRDGLRRLYFRNTNQDTSSHP